MTTEVLVDESTAAPHGRDDAGVPLAPYGYLKDGITPRKSNRGARPGERRGGKAGTRPRSRPRGARVATSSKNDKERREALVALTDMLIVTPLAGLSASPQLAARVGPRQAMALAGDAVIVSTYAPHVADGLIVLSQTKPGALAWLDTVEEKAPYLMLVNVGLQMTKAFVENHLNPNPALADAGRLTLKMRAEEMAQAVRREAEAMGIDLSEHEPTVPMPNGHAQSA
jgi:hypothetical protein